MALPELNEQYHSVHGAIQESKAVYIQNGFEALSFDSIKILEIGFGTGLNCLLSYDAQCNTSPLKTVEYCALEPYPPEAHLLTQLNYVSFSKAKNSDLFFNQIHSIASKEPQMIAPEFYFSKLPYTVEAYSEKKESFNLIYFDAFGPAIQPEMWTKEVFQKMYDLLKPHGILVTYCAKGEVKRILKSVGFTYESLAGPPGKREVTRARKQ